MIRIKRHEPFVSWRGVFWWSDYVVVEIVWNNFFSSVIGDTQDNTSSVTAKQLVVERYRRVSDVLYGHCQLKRSVHAQRSMILSAQFELKLGAPRLTNTRHRQHQDTKGKDYTKRSHVSPHLTGEL
jgi:hypothetical protein